MVRCIEGGQPNVNEDMKEQYRTFLNQYIASKKEVDLYRGEQLSKEMLETGVSPEELVSYHIETIKTEHPDLPEDVIRSFNFLVEVMVGYGIQYREHQSLLQKQIQLQSDIEVAAGMQQTLLPDVPHHIPNIDLGMFSVAAKQMSGDYYHFNYKPYRGYLGMAVADIIGKGIPAALCMSMIKYAIESLPEYNLEPHVLMENINRVVEKNIDPSMFITMIYGAYDLKTHLFQYATAGHEPAIYYSQNDEMYYDLQSKGVVLGLNPDSTYTCFEQVIHPGDMIILFSDGVTETQKDGRFIQRQDFIQLIREYQHLEAQHMAEELQQALLAWSDFDLKDDQTIIIVKRPEKP